MNLHVPNLQRLCLSTLQLNMALSIDGSIIGDYENAEAHPLELPPQYAVFQAPAICWSAGFAVAADGVMEAHLRIFMA